MQGSRYNKSEHNGNFIVGGVAVITIFIKT